MASLNKVLLIGNLTRDPEVRFTPAGKAVGDLNMAVNRKYRAQDNSVKEDTCFVTVVVWGKQAETCSQYLHKGSMILVEGRLQYEKWEKDGVKHSTLKVVAERVRFLDSRSGSETAKETPAADGEQESSFGAGAMAAAPAGGPMADDAEVDGDNLPF